MADSVLQSPTIPHFFQPLLPGFISHLSIPVTFFSKYLKGGNQPKTAKLRSDASDTAWEVEIDDGRRLTGGWNEFVTAHDLRIGDVVVFRHEGEFSFHVTALGPSCCEIDYKSSHYIDDNDDDDDDNIETKIEKKRAKKNPKREEASSSSDNTCFMANVSSSSLRNDRVYVPRSFTRWNGLSKAYGKVVLLNEKGDSWKLSLDHDKSGDHTYLRHGWRSFCDANGMNRGRYKFTLVSNSRTGTRTPVIRLCKAEYRTRVAESLSDRSCFVGCVSSCSLRTDRQYLPREFVKSNGLNKECGEIVLKNEYGGKWNLLLRHNSSSNITVIRRGWRSFCRANGLKARDFFGFNLIRTGETPVLCLCPAETRTRIVESSESTDVNSLSTNLSSGEECSETEESVKEESEEESIEVKRRFVKCLNIAKRKYCSKRGASSSPSQNRFVTLCMTQSSVKCKRVRLPVCFTRANGVNNPGTITLLGQDGVIRMVVPLLKDNSQGRLKLRGSGWIRFCEVHGVKIGEWFKLELIWEKEASPVLKFCSKVNFD